MLVRIRFRALYGIVFEFFRLPPSEYTSSSTKGAGDFVVSRVPSEWHRVPHAGGHPERFLLLALL